MHFTGWCALEIRGWDWDGKIWRSRGDLSLNHGEQENISRQQLFFVMLWTCKKEVTKIYKTVLPLRINHFYAWDSYWCSRCVSQDEFFFFFSLVDMSWRGGEQLWSPSIIITWRQDILMLFLAWGIGICRTIWKLRMSTCKHYYFKGNLPWVGKILFQFLPDW